MLERREEIAFEKFLD